MIEPHTLFANAGLAAVLFVFWLGHVFRYKMKLLAHITKLDIAIQRHADMGFKWSVHRMVAERSVVKSELYQLQKLTNYSGFR